MKRTLVRNKNNGGVKMKRIMNRLPRENRGFTLVELLVVIGVMAILSAVVLLNVTGVIGEGETEAAATELVTIQTAVDVMMARNDLSSVNTTSATSDMAALPTGNVLYPDYLRTETTKGTYSVSSNGKVTQATTGY